MEFVFAADFQSALHRRQRPHAAIFLKDVLGRSIEDVPKSAWHLFGRKSCDFARRFFGGGKHAPHHDRACASCEGFDGVT